MLILWKGYQRDPSKGWAHTFLTQMEEVLGTCVDRGIKVVTNAGGLNPAGLADQVRAPGRPARARRRRSPTSKATTSSPASASCEQAGHPPRPPRHRPAPGRGHRRGGLGQRLPRGLAHRRGAARRGRRGHLPPDHRRLAGGRARRPGTTAGRRPTGTAWPGRWWPATSSSAGPRPPGATTPSSPRSPGVEHPGFPIAEVAEDGSSVITKHPGTGGEVSVGTVTAQLLYEIAGPHYPNTDVVARFDTIDRRPGGPGPGADRRAPGACPAPDDVKVCLNLLGGWRNTMTFVLTGLDIEEKADAHPAAPWSEPWAAPTSSPSSTPGSSAPTSPTPRPTSRPPPSCGSRSRTPTPSGWAGASPSAATELALAGYPGLHLTAPPDRRPPPTACTGRRWSRPTWWSPRSSTPTARRVAVPHTAYLAGSDGVADRRLAAGPGAGAAPAPTPTARPAADAGGPTRRLPLGHHHRGPLRRQGGQRQRRAVGPVRRGLGVARRATSPSSGSGRLLPEADELEVRRYALPQPARPQLRGGRPAGRGRGLLHPARSPGQGPGRVPSEQAGRHPGRPASADAPEPTDPEPSRGAPWTSSKPTSSRCCARRSAPSPPSSATSTT